MDIQHLRKNYRLASFDRKDLAPNPLDQFKIWFQDAMNAQVDEPNAMSLATATREGRPSLRMVLLKQFGEDGFIFFTNYESRKAKELAENPYASCNLFWRELERQVCIEGKVEKVPIETSEKYFSERPRGSQLGTWASKQDSIIESRAVLEQEYQRKAQQYLGNSIPLPEFWGGFMIRPERYEFWQGREDRLHDRFQYIKVGSDWQVDRLSP